TSIAPQTAPVTDALLTSREAYASSPPPRRLVSAGRAPASRTWPRPRLASKHRKRRARRAGRADDRQRRENIGELISPGRRERVQVEALMQIDSMAHHQMLMAERAVAPGGCLAPEPRTMSARAAGHAQFEAPAWRKRHAFER